MQNAELVADPAAAPIARVAVVEDDHELRERILVPGLADFGFATQGMASAAALYREMLGSAFDLVVLDVGLPEEDGFSVARHLRQTLQMRIGIVMLTGRTRSHDRIRGLDEGSDAYLSKPVELEVLAATLHSLLRRMRAGVAPTASVEATPDWRLEPDGWCLRSPDGLQVALTLTERRILMRLFEVRGEPIARDALIAELTDDIHAFDPHRLEMTVHRLRRKIEERTGEAPPLRAVRGSGYAFTR